MSLKIESATIVGAGLVGSLWSVFLAKKGTNVTVFESRSDLRQNNISAGRSINLALSRRGMAALEAVGLKEQVEKLTIPMRGRMVHELGKEPSLQPYGMKASECIHSIGRGDLNRLLLNEADTTGKVQMFFEHRLEKFDWQSKIMKIKRPLGELSVEVQGPIFGTDGANSVLRETISCMVKSEVLSHSYKELALPAGENGKHLLEKNALHIWPRKSFMLIALPNLDGSFTVTLFLNGSGPLSFESLKNEPDISEFFEEYFPDVIKLIPDLVFQFERNPVGGMTTLRVPQWSFSDQMVLLGDAAHAIVPFFGQGMNCGFEDCVILDELLVKHKVGEAFDKFSELRPLDSNSIADMALENFIEMRDSVSNPVYLRRKNIESELSREFSDYVSKYRLVSFSRVPYSIAEKVGKIQAQILEELDTESKIDMEKARHLVETRLVPVVRKFKNSEDIWI